MQLKIETGGEIAEEPDANLKKRKIGEPQISTQAGRRAFRQTHKRESEHASNVESSTFLAGCIAAVGHTCGRRHLSERI